MSFVLNREATLWATQEETCDSPKLWRPGGGENVSAAQPKQSVSPTNRVGSGRTKEDLFNYYESMSSSAAHVDLSLKDLVERTQIRKSTNSVLLKKIQESVANHRAEPVADDSSGTFKWWNNRKDREKLPKASKVIVPSKANGDQPREQLPEPPRKSFGEYLEERCGDGAESLQILRGVKPEPTSLGGHRGLPPGVSPGSRAAVVRPTPRNHHENHHPSRSPLRSPARSRSASPHREHKERASSPARLGGYGRDVEGIDWTNPATSPRHWGNTLFSPSPMVREHYAKEYHPSHRKHQHHSSESSGDHKGQRLLLADMFKTKEDSVPSGHKAQSTKSKHCSACSSSTLLKTRCVVCKKIYCRNCVEHNMRRMPEGRKCTTTCLDEPTRSQHVSEDCKCWPFLRPNRVQEAESKSARRRDTTRSQAKLRANGKKRTAPPDTVYSNCNSRNSRTTTSSVASSI